MAKRCIFLILLWIFIAPIWLTAQGQESPNIVIILADDLGSGDISSYNKKSKIQTPHIDKVAERGIRFTNAHSPAAICTPARYSLLTGRYSWRTHLKNGVLWPWDGPLIKPERVTMPEMLQEQGYFTAAVGKWHLGWEWPTRDNQKVEGAGKNVDFSKPIKVGPLSHGFDYYFGDDVPNFPPYTFIENRRVAVVPTEQKPNSMFGHSGPMAEGWRLDAVIPTITEKSVSVIDSLANTAEQTPFFLYFSLTAPHTPIVPVDQFRGKSDAGAYGDYVFQIDWSVGQVMQALKRHNLDENTLVIFTSDNGSPARDGTNMSGELNSVTDKYGHDPSNGLRGMKADVWEGGHRVPFIAYWPGTIPFDVESEEVISLVDIMATIAELTNYQLDDSMAEDSYSITAPLLDKDYSVPLREATVYVSGAGALGIQQREWKLILCSGSGGWSKPKQCPDDDNLPDLQLYNLKTDPFEENNLANQYPQKVENMKALLRKYIREGRSTPGEPQKNAMNVNWPQIEDLMSE